MAHGESNHHIIPKATLLKVFGGLIVLTVITVAVAYVPLGPLNIPVAIAIAASKASLVVMFFMALKYDNPVNSLTFTIGVIFVLVFIVFTLFDTAFRGDLDNVDELTIDEVNQQIEEQQRRQEQLSPEQLRVTPSDFGTTGSEADTGATDEGS